MGDSLKGRVAVVTGGGRGIGAEIAALFGAEGAAVLVNDLGSAGDGTGADSAPAQQVADLIAESGGTAIADGTDVTDHQATAAMIERAISEFGGLDILVNTAGILRDKMIFNLAEQDWDAVVAVHLKGHYNTIKPAAQYWRSLRNEHANHRIINFTSVSGLHGSAGQPNYAAAKMGVVGLTYSCANALRRYGVTTNAILPGAASRLVATVPTERRHEANRAPGPEHIAPIAAYLASTRSGWLNGRVVGARGPSVELYNIPEPIRVVATDGQWRLDTLADLVETHFRAPAKQPLTPPWFATAD